VQVVLSNEIFVLAFASVLWQVEKKIRAHGLSGGLLHGFDCVTCFSGGMYRLTGLEENTDKWPFFRCFGALLALWFGLYST
jgi:hypothetical protein